MASDLSNLWFEVPQIVMYLTTEKQESDILKTTTVNCGLLKLRIIILRSISM